MSSTPSATPPMAPCRQQVPKVGDLSNPIHPIFSRPNFAGSSWDYPILEPALRLASRLLDTDSLLEFPHALYHGARQTLPHPAKLGEAYRAFFRRNEPGDALTPQQLFEVRASLRPLADSVRFYLSEDMEGEAARGVCCATETPSADGGWKVRILILRPEYLALTSSSGTDSEFAYLMFADLLCHELMHAAMWACDADHFQPFEYHVIAEAGFEWSCYVFGGVFEWADQSEKLVLSEYPFPGKLECFRAAGGEGGILVLLDIPRIEVRWDVSAEYVRALFTTRFWEVEVPARGAEALKVEKQHGFRILLGKDFGLDGEYSLFAPRTGEADFLEGLPQGCVVDPDGRGFSRPSA